MSQVRIDRFTYRRAEKAIHMTVTYPTYKSRTVITTSHRAFPDILKDFPKLERIGAVVTMTGETATTYGNSSWEKTNIFS